MERKEVDSLTTWTKGIGGRVGSSGGGEEEKEAREGERGERGKRGSGAMRPNWGGGKGIRNKTWDYWGRGMRKGNRKDREGYSREGYLELGWSGRVAVSGSEQQQASSTQQQHAEASGQQAGGRSRKIVSQCRRN